MRVYISGKISGTEDYKERFAKAEKKLWREGFRTVNPLDIPAHCNDGEPSWSDYMREDIKRLVDCKAIYMMKGWKESKGASLEHHIAIELGMVVFYEDWKEE